MPSKLAAAAVVLAALVAVRASADPEVNQAPGVTQAPDVIEWKFSYSGSRVYARGVVVTAAMPEPDGSYRILSIAGKRNGKRIVELVPEGELVTTHGFLFADNRLMAASPFVGEAGFTYRTTGAQIFNVCHSGEGGFCGGKGYREYQEGFGRPIKLEVTRVAPPEPRPAGSESPGERVAGDSAR
jgi:hypothetical protein